MKIDQLLGLSFVPNADLSKEELTVRSTYMDRELSRSGLTLAKNIPAYESVSGLIREAKIPEDHSTQVYCIEYKGEKALPSDAARVSVSDLAKSDYIRIKDLSSEAFEPIHEIVWSWVETNNLTEEMKTKGFLKQTSEGLKPKLTATRLVIADYPQLIGDIHMLPEFNHLDAISYEIKIAGQMEEFITIFRDNNLLLDDFAKNQNHIRGSMSNYKGYLCLPDTVVKTGTLQTYDALKEQLNDSTSFKVA
ncbi:hypothetical protein ACVP6W_002324 [Vibrio cholerae]|nr:hypothetical protein [Vibrio cholerae]